MATAIGNFMDVNIKSYRYTAPQQVREVAGSIPAPGIDDGVELRSTSS